MAKKNYYAVRQGRKPGIYRTWAECKAQVDGYKNAEYKGFATMEEASGFMNTGCQMMTGSNKTKRVHPDRDMLMPEAPEFIAYVDGSYYRNSFSYGCIIFDGENVKEFKRAFHNHKDAELHNVAGELHGAMKAIDYALKHLAKSIDIYYDYKGIECWANGEWKTNKPATKAYKQYVEKTRKNIEVRFHKVKGHSGDTWNERADRLAKDALGL